MLRNTKTDKNTPNKIFKGEIKICMPKKDKEAIGSHINGARIEKIFSIIFSAKANESFPESAKDKCCILIK